MHRFYRILDPITTILLRLPYEINYEWIQVLRKKRATQLCSKVPDMSPVLRKSDLNIEKQQFSTVFNLHAQQTLNNCLVDESPKCDLM
jgi:hypothetical protein